MFKDINLAWRADVSDTEREIKRLYCQNEKD
jgi:hypothetical protein